MLAPTALLPAPLTPSTRLCRASLKLHGANLISSASLAASQINFSPLGSLGILIFWYHSHIVTLYPCLSWGRSGFVSGYSAQERKARPAVFLIYRYHVFCEACEPDLSHPKTLRARDLVLVEAIFSLTSSLFITAVSSDGFGSSSVAVYFINASLGEDFINFSHFQRTPPPLVLVAMIRIWVCSVWVKPPLDPM